MESLDAAAEETAPVVADLTTPRGAAIGPVEVLFVRAAASDAVLPIRVLGALSAIRLAVEIALTDEPVRVRGATGCAVDVDRALREGAEGAGGALDLPEVREEVEVPDATRRIEVPPL